MKQADRSKKNKSAEGVVSQSKPAADKSGPTELSTDDLKKVSGGLPKGGWGVRTLQVPKKDI